MLGSNMSKLFVMQCESFSLSNDILVFTHIYYDTLSLVSRMKSLIYLFLSSKFICKRIKIRNVQNELNEYQSISNNDFI